MKLAAVLAVSRSRFLTMLGCRRCWRGLLQSLLLVALAVTGVSHAQPVYWSISEHFPDLVETGDDMRSVELPDGRTVRVGTVFNGSYPYHAMGVVRFNADGTPDRGFGRNGMVKLNVWGTGDGRDIVRQADGKFLVGGNAVDPASENFDCSYAGDLIECNTYIALFRLNHDGSLDTSFNGNGRLVFHVGAASPGSDESPEVYLSRIGLNADGTAVVIARGKSYDPFIGPSVARINTDGTLDHSFVPVGTTKVAREANFTVAVQFRNANLDQYFVTSDLAEIANLDRDLKRGWSYRSGGFRVYPAGTNLATSVPVCRFYGRPEAGLDSHLLSANADECAALEAAGDREWILEGREVFRVELPDPVTGACPVGRAPVYRLWNGRRDSGHMFTTDRATQEWLTTHKFYVAEGWGPNGVAMCAAP